MPFLSAYAASKAAVVRFGETLAEELREAGTDVNVSRQRRSIPASWRTCSQQGQKSLAGLTTKPRCARGIGRCVPEACRRALCASRQIREYGITGKLISAVWDPWMDLTVHRQDLGKTDVYTLPRIVPSERGYLGVDDARRH
jgi:hypothetical protein